MKSQRTFVAGSTDLVYIILIAETEREKATLKENKHQEIIEGYFHDAVDEIGNKDEEYELQQVVNKDQWPYAAIVKIKNISDPGIT